MNEQQKINYKWSHPISAELIRRGFKLTGKSCRCPFHEDRSPSFSINSDDTLWNCHAGCGGGDIFDLIAKLDGKTMKEVLDELSPIGETERFVPQPNRKEENQAAPGKVVATYKYQDALGRDAFEVLRYEPKTFRQRHFKDGKWVMNMDRVERVLYRLPEVQKAQVVWIVEGEKDADTMALLGFCATCNVCGAGKWLAAYSESLAGKDVVICGDNDKPGQEHAAMVFEELAGKVATARIVQVPKIYKDVTEYTSTFTEDGDAATVMKELFDRATVFVKGVKMPIYYMQEILPAYKRHTQDLNNSSFDIGKWLPTLGRHVRALVPGELVLILGETGVGKTAVLSNIAMHAAPMKTLFFEMELPAILMYERLVAYKKQMTGKEVETAYRDGTTSAPNAAEVEEMFSHLAICTESKLTPEKIEQYIIRSELKFGERPKIVLLDYVQLAQSKGNSRYERMSNTAEELKVMAKETGVILFVASQVGRKGKDDGIDIGLCDGKDSGSLENSGGLVLGAWRDHQNKEIMHIKILKNTKGQSGWVVTCNYNGAQQRITEKSKVNDEDVPARTYPYTE